MKKLLNKAKEISYSKFRKLGYTGNFDDFSYEINKLILMSKELDAPSLDIAGGKSCQRSKFLSGGLGVLTALSACGFDTAMANKLPDTISSHTRKRRVLNESDQTMATILSVFAFGGLIVGGLGTAAVITRFKDEPAVSLSSEDLERFTTIDRLRSEKISTEPISDETKKAVFLEFVNKFIEYSKITLENINIAGLFADCDTCELNTNSIRNNYNYINRKLRQFTKKEINKNAFWGCYNLYVFAYQNELKEIKLTTVNKKLVEERNRTNYLQTHYQELEEQTNKEITSVQTELAKAKKDREEIQKTVDDLNQKKNELQTIQEDLEKVETELAKTKKDKDELQKQVDELTQQQKMNDELKEQNQRDIEEVETELAKAKEEKDELQKKVDELTDRQKELPGPVPDKNDQLDNVSAELLTIKHDYGIVTRQYTALLEKHNELTEKAEDLVNHIKTFSEQISVEYEQSSDLDQPDPACTEELNTDLMTKCQTECKTETPDYDLVKQQNTNLLERNKNLENKTAALVNQLKTFSDTITVGSAQSSDLNQPKPACTHNLTTEVMNKCAPTYGTKEYDIMLIKNYLLMLNAERQMLKDYQTTMKDAVDELLTPEPKNLSENDRRRAYRYCYVDDLMGMIDIINPMMTAYTETLKHYAPDKELIKVPFKTIMHSELQHLINSDGINPEMNEEQSEQFVDNYRQLKAPRENIEELYDNFEQYYEQHLQQVRAQLEYLLRLILTVGSGTSEFIGSDRNNRLTPDKCLSWLTELLCGKTKRWTAPLLEDRTELLLLRTVRTAIQHSIISEIQIKAIDFLDQREDGAGTSLSEEDAEKAARKIIEDYYKNDREESNKIN